MASSSSPYAPSEYDVFLSFRGEETRKGFVSHLYDALERMGIKTFKDDKKLEKGSSISPALLQAIEKSRFAIVVISVDYASSGWCLDELAKIMECSKRRLLTVVPIFYGVDPSNVRRQTGSFAQAFKRHEKKFKEQEKIQRWKEALTTLGNIAGEDSQNWMEDSKLIQKTVGDILCRLCPSLPNTDLVGMDAHMKEMIPLLCMESTNEVRIIGICGMGGVGKTTLARVLFERLSRQFQARYFFENVKEIYKYGGLKHLQERFLSGTLQIKEDELTGLLVSHMMRTRLQSRIILTVLDDVDRVDQLHALVDSTEWFGPGSRIIVTTRDRHLLDAHRVKQVHEVKCLGNFDAHQLFNWHAFKGVHADDTFLQLSSRVMKFAGGLPLALKVLGSFLCGRKKEHWESELHKLERSPPKDVMEVLRVSYDGLDEQQKKIFLCIACIFRGESEDRVISLLGYSAKIGIQVLADKYLLEISSFGCISMHDLLQQMGRELGKHKFLWDVESSRDMLTYSKGIHKLEGISLHTSNANELFKVNAYAFKKMRNLKFLKISDKSKLNVTPQIGLPEDLTNFPCKLRLLHWRGYPSKTLPLGFNPEFLVELIMPSSKLRRLWEGMQPLKSLRKMSLRCSRWLKELPDLSTAVNLEILDLKECRSLVEIPSSVQNLEKLEHLDLSRCSQLKRLPSKINSQHLDVTACYSLEKIPEMSEKVTKFRLVATESIEDLPPSFGHLSGIVHLELINCGRLRTLPSTIGDMAGLRHLEISRCGMLRNIPNTIQKLKSLKILKILDCPGITEFPHVPENIETLWLRNTGIPYDPNPLWIRENLSRLKELEISRPPQIMQDLEVLGVILHSGESVNKTVKLFFFHIFTFFFHIFVFLGLIILFIGFVEHYRTQ